MGTRGLSGFYYKGKYYVMYNQLDSYPDGLGSIIITEIREAIKMAVLKHGNHYWIILKLLIIL